MFKRTVQAKETIPFVCPASTKQLALALSTMVTTTSPRV
jgi:hypothetical protein